LLARKNGKARVHGPGKNVVAPVFLDDVVQALLAASKGGTAGTYELAGPDRMTMDDLARLVNRDPSVRVGHMNPGLASLLGRVLPALSPTLVEVVTADSVGDASAAAAAFGLSFRSLRDAWASSPVRSTGS
jgi:uncharacterized protein YbjT (DUF2867 family)